MLHLLDKATINRSRRQRPEGAARREDAGDDRESFGIEVQRCGGPQENRRHSGQADGCVAPYHRHTGRHDGLLKKEQDSTTEAVHSKPRVVRRCRVDDRLRHRGVVTINEIIAWAEAHGVNTPEMVMLLSLVSGHYPIIAIRHYVYGRTRSDNAITRALALWRENDNFRKSYNDGVAWIEGVRARNTSIRSLSKKKQVTPHTT